MLRPPLIRQGLIHWYDVILSTGKFSIKWLMFYLVLPPPSSGLEQHYAHRGACLQHRQTNLTRFVMHFMLWLICAVQFWGLEKSVHSQIFSICSHDLLWNVARLTRFNHSLSCFVLSSSIHRVKARNTPWTGRQSITRTHTHHSLSRSHQGPI